MSVHVKEEVHMVVVVEGVNELVVVVKVLEGALEEVRGMESLDKVAQEDVGAAQVEQDNILEWDVV